MKGRRYSWDVLRVVNRKLDKEVMHLQDLYKVPVLEADTPEEHLVLMISRIIYMTESLSLCMKTNNGSLIESCRAFAGEIHAHERLATVGLVNQASLMGKCMFKAVVRFPSSLKRIAKVLDDILECCSLKTAKNIDFSVIAQLELSLIFKVALNMLEKLRDTLVLHNKYLLGQIKFDRRRLQQLVEDALIANWERMEAGTCPPLTASVYVEILDCLRNLNECVAGMGQSLRDIGRLTPEC